jgi:hypothetical protein
MAPAIEKMSGIPCDLDHIILVATPETDRAVEMGDDPTWRILRKNDDGTSQFYTDPDGNPLIYSLSDGVRRAIYLNDLQAAKIEKDENPSFGEVLEEVFYPLFLDRIIPPSWRRGLVNFPSWVLSGLGKSLEKGYEFATGTHLSVGEMGKSLKEKAMRGASSLIGVTRALWENPDARKRELIKLLELDLEMEAPPKATNTRKEWDAARRKRK